MTARGSHGKVYMKIIGSFIVVGLAVLTARLSSSRDSSWIMYVGTYTGQTSKGIYAYRLDTSSGAVTPIDAAGGLAAETKDPSFLALHPNQRFLYAVGEDSNGSVSAFAIDDATGRLKLLNTVSSKGSAPCHLKFDRTGKWLFVANYNSGNIAAFPVHDGGTLGEASTFIQHSGSSKDPKRQTGPHAHSVNISPDNRFLVVMDLGLDKALVYRFDSTSGSLTPNDPPFAKVTAGSGPRHMTFSTNGKFTYVLNELSSTVTAFDYDKRSGSLKEIQTLPALPADFAGVSSGAEIIVHPKGKFLYSSNRGHDSIAKFDIESKKGMLKSGTWVATQGKTPRNFAIDPTGRYLFVANQDSNSIVVFRIDQKTGNLTATGTVLDVPSPVCVVFAAK